MRDIRVYELAIELNATSKEVLNHLWFLGSEAPRSPSSRIEPVFAQAVITSWRTS